MTYQELLEHNKKRTIKQLAFVTNDLEKALEQWVTLLNVGPWTVYTFSNETMKDYYVNGKLVTEPFEYRVALSDMGNMNIEVIQPVKGANVYGEFLDTKGEGLHHFKEHIKDEDFPAYLNELEEKGLKPIQQGWCGPDLHVYIDTMPELHINYELGNCPPEINIPDKFVKHYPEKAGPQYERLLKHNKMRTVKQIAILTTDMDTALKKWVDLLNVGPWTVYTFSNETMKDYKINGELVTEPFEFKVALSDIGSTNMEIMMPVKGPNIYGEFLKNKGEGLHHFKEYIRGEDFPAYLKMLEEKGFKPIQQGWCGPDLHIYMDTMPVMKFNYELGNCPPEINIPEEFVEYYPPRNEKI